MGASRPDASRTNGTADERMTMTPTSGGGGAGGASFLPHAATNKAATAAEISCKRECILFFEAGETGVCTGWVARFYPTKGVVTQQRGRLPEAHDRDNASVRIREVGGPTDWRAEPCCRRA